MKIAVVHNLPPGGQKRALYEQVKRLSRKHTLDLYTLSSTDETFLPLKPFIRNHFQFPYHYPSHFPSTLISILTGLKNAYQEMATAIDRGGYDGAFVSPCYLTQSPYVLRFLKTPSLYYCPEPKREFYENIPHAGNKLSYLLTYPFRLAIKAVDRENARCATKIVTNSEYSSRMIKAAFGKDSSLNYLGVDTDLFKPMKIDRENWVLSVGGLSLHKGQDFVIRSLSHIPQTIRPVYLIVGDGTELKYLLGLSETYGVKMIILNNINDNELVKIFNRSLIYVSGALNEPFGLSLLESISCGTRVVAVNEGGAGEIIKNKSAGFLVKRDEKEMSEAIIMMIKNMGRLEEKKVCHEWVRKNWSWDKSVKELEIYLRFCHSRLDRESIHL